MVKVLFDTCVVSELQKPKPNEHVLNTVDAVRRGQSYLSVITIGEARLGVNLLPPGKRRTHLEHWVLELERRFAGRILPLDLESAHIWGDIVARARLQGHQIGVPDGLIAATAIRHGMRVMTRNVRHFEPTGVLLTNPWASDQD